MKINETTLPANVEAERALLGCLILDNSQIDAALEILPAVPTGRTAAAEPLFFDPRNEMIFEAVVHMREHGAGVDLTTLAGVLRDRGQLEAMGGAGYLAGLEDDIFSLGQVPEYARVIVAKWRRRRMIRLGQELMRQSADARVELEEVLDLAERGLMAVAGTEGRRGFSPIGAIVGEEVAALEHPEKRETPGLPTGFHELDKLTGGLMPGQMVVVAARPSIGKSAFVTNIAVHASLRKKIPVAFFSLEMSRRELGQRILSTLARATLSSLRVPEELGPFTLTALREAGELLARVPLFIEDERNLSITQLRSRLRRLKTLNPGLGLVVVDYLQLVGDTGRYAGSKVNEVGEVSRAFKNLAGELELPFIVLSQLSRETERRKSQGKGAGTEDAMPRLSDLRDSGAVEQDADIVIFIDRTEGKARVKVAKQRNGPTGIFKLTFLGDYTEFVNPMD